MKLYNSIFLAGVVWCGGPSLLAQEISSVQHVSASHWRAIRESSEKSVLHARKGVHNIVIFKSDEDKQRGSADGGTDCDYRRWTAGLEHSQLLNPIRKCAATAQVLTLGAVAFVRSIDESCSVRAKTVLGASKPFTLAAQNREYEIVDVFALPRSRSQDARLTVFLTTKGEVSEAFAKQAVVALSALANTKTLTVVLRSDRWFFTHCDAPKSFIFRDAETRIPSEQKIMTSAEAVCSRFEPWPVHCFGVNTRRE